MWFKKQEAWSDRFDKCVMMNTSSTCGNARTEGEMYLWCNAMTPDI